LGTLESHVFLHGKVGKLNDLERPPSWKRHVTTRAGTFNVELFPEPPLGDQRALDCRYRDEAGADFKDMAVVGQALLLWVETPVLIVDYHSFRELVEEQWSDRVRKKHQGRPCNLPSLVRDRR